MSKPKHILITGGTGLIGSNLTKQLLANGYKVSHLSRTVRNEPNVRTYLYNIDKGKIDEHCIDGVDLVVHLAGAGIAEKRWTKKRKKELIDSRTKSIGLVYQAIKNHPNQVKAVVSASAIGYYSDRGDELLTEDSAPDSDFMATCCVNWEQAVDEGKKLNLRVVKFRTGVVLDKGGALGKLAVPVKLCIGSPLGTGKQWVPWIHWKDVIAMYMQAIENETYNGVYNMVSPNPVTNAELTKAVAKQLHKPLWAPKVPAFVLKAIMGEMSTVVLGSTKVSSQKIEGTGFKFQYPDVASALKEIYG